MFKPSTPYFLDQNNVLERIGRTIIDMTRRIIFEGNIDNDLWPKIILIMPQVSDLRATSVVDGDNSYQALFNNTLSINYL